MTVTAPADTSSPETAILSDIRGPGMATAGTLAYEIDHLVTGWHWHRLHQVEYALEGVAEVTTPIGRYLVPPQQAIWIPAGVRHTVTFRQVRSVSVFFEPSFVPPEVCDRSRVLGVAPVLREMLVYGQRWPIDRQEEDPAADVFFAALAGVVLDHLDREQPLYLPSTADPLIAAVIEHTERHLATVTTTDIRDALGVTERTLRRRFPEATGMSWRTFVRQARLLRAMAMLAQPRPTVLEIAATVGFESPSAFGRAYREWTGMSPAAYRHQVLHR